MNFKALLKSARGEEPCDLLFKNAAFANLCTMEYERGDIAVKDGIIIGIGEGYEAKESVDCEGRLLLPGFIEGHMHVESTFMTPRSLAAAISPLGTTTVMPDPHEIANTCGVEGIRFMRRESDGLPVDFFYGAPSCVPASAQETPFEEIEAEEIKKLLADGTCAHLGEMMNFPGVCLGDDKVWAKLDAARGLVITGHAPRLKGKELAAYLLGGISSDHECSCEEEALEKLRRGMYLMIRQGATARNLSALAPLLVKNPAFATRCLTVSDDINPIFMLRRGHLDGCLRELIECGVEPLAALRTVTLTPAEYFRLDDRGMIAPGKIADIVMTDTLDEKFRVLKVWKRGKLVAEDGRTLEKITPAVLSALPGYSGEARTPTAEELRVKIENPEAMINVIGVIPEQVVTETLQMPPTNIGGFACADAERGLAKMAVVEKNRGTGRFAVGFIHGFGLTRGAVASSVAHDAHNFTCAGMDDLSMSAALRELARIGGGIVVADGEKILAEIKLPVGGLMSLLSVGEGKAKLEELAAARDALGCSNEHAFMQLSFMSLSVIPELKLTDKGYFDISGCGVMPLFVR
ncbi:MAG: adenine deaminase [Synergistaceae bacterium]|nr:adenine deaminase [Synergistaceae bacterium]